MAPPPSQGSARDICLPAAPAPPLKSADGVPADWPGHSRPGRLTIGLQTPPPLPREFSPPALRTTGGYSAPWDTQPRRHSTPPPPADVPPPAARQGSVPPGSAPSPALPPTAPAPCASSRTPASGRSGPVLAPSAQTLPPDRPHPG